MSSEGVGVAEGDAARSTATDLAAVRPGLIWVLVLASWCGLVAGLLEVTAIVTRKSLDPNRFLLLSRDFVWLIPMTNLLVFVILGLLSWLVIGVWPRRGRWLVTRGLCALTIWPVALAGAPQIYALAWLAVALGLASRVVPVLERNVGRLHRLVWVSLPVAAGVVAALAAYPRVADTIAQSREDARDVPAGAPANVLLVVMDTVAAEHLGLYGYSRSTSNTLVELAERGIRFDSARSTCSWTLPSHASMFTGRWFHEISSGWLTPLDGTYPTLAEFLGARGYATSAFTANYTYCARDSGLARGFTHFEDVYFPELTCFKLAAVVNRTLEGIQAVEDFLEGPLEFAELRPYLKYLWWLMDTNRKDAAMVNRQFLDWLSTRSQPQRPFFTFLNYYDAHYPYQLTPGRMHRYGAVAIDFATRDMIQRWPLLGKESLTPKDIAFAIDAYDECIADLDEQLGVLFDELERRGILKKTWLIVVADHGESFGEHADVFRHGESLYQTEVHVPLLIVPPGGTTKRILGEAVSLRDLPATVLDVLGMTAGSPFPGDSLARLWQKPSPAADPGGRALAEVVPLDPASGGPAGPAKKIWPLGGVSDGNWSYIRREGDVREELFDLRNDVKEQRNLVDDPAARTALERMRARLKDLTAGPLTPDRFNP